MFAVDEAHYLADRIPDSTLVLLDGEDHFVSGDPQQILDAVEPFVAAVSTTESSSALAAVTAPVGPDVDQVVAALEDVGGRVRRAVTGGTLVLFDGPATAARAGLDAVRSAPEGRIGLTIAEVPTDGRPLRGVAIDEARTLGETAAAGEVLVGATAATLLAGSGVPLEELGRPGQSPAAFRVVST